MLFGKKKEETKVCVCAGQSDCPAAEMSSPEGTVTTIKVLGSGCKSCHQLFENAAEAAKSKALPVEVEYVTDPERIMAYGVMSMPALVVNEKVVSMGRLLSKADIERML